MTIYPKRMTAERELIIAAYAESHEVLNLTQARELIHALQAERAHSAKVEAEKEALRNGRLVTRSELEKAIRGITPGTVVALFGYLATLGVGEIRLLVHLGSEVENRAWSDGLPRGGKYDGATFEAAFRFGLAAPTEET